MAAYESNTGSPHPLAGGIMPLSKRDTGSDPLTDSDNDLWFGTVSIGTPPKVFAGVTLFSPVQNWQIDLMPYTVDFDTGSSDLFVPSIKCDSSCSGHKAYDPSASCTSKDLNKTFSISYGDGSTSSGEQYSDNVIVAGLTVR
jgi:cathepsin D